MSIPDRIANHIQTYSTSVGGGNRSRRVSNAFHEKGFVAGVAQFRDECVTDGIRAMNRFGLSHSRNIGAYSVLFLLASPLVAELVVNPQTHGLGVAIANNVPILAAGWVDSPNNEDIQLDNIQKAEQVAPKFGRELGASQVRQAHPEAENRTIMEIINMYGTKKK